MGYTKEEYDFLERGRDISSPAIWATKLSAHFGDNNVAQMSRQICSHTPSALNAGAKRSGATCHMPMPQCYYLAKGAKRPSHTTNMLTSFNISVNWSIWPTHLVDTLSPMWPTPYCRPNGWWRNIPDPPGTSKKCAFFLWHLPSDVEESDSQLNKWCGLVDKICRNDEENPERYDDHETTILSR